MVLRMGPQSSNTGDWRPSKKRDRQQSALSVHTQMEGHVRTRRGQTPTSQKEERRGVSTETNPVGVLILNFQPLEL